MAFTFLSLELLLVCAVVMVYTRYRKSTIFSLALVKDLTIYMPPSQADFEALKESINPPSVRENSKGKKNRFEAKKAKAAQKPARFPLRQMEMSTELLQYCNQFFADFDFLLMLFHYSVLMFFTVLVMKIAVPVELTQTNLTFYMTTMTLALVYSNMRRGCFPTGLTKLTDETKLMVLFAFKSFIVVWCLLVYSEGALEQFFGIEI